MTSITTLNFSIHRADKKQRTIELPSDSGKSNRTCHLFILKKTNIVFNFAEVLWYLSGSNDLDFISYYNKNAFIFNE